MAGVAAAAGYPPPIVDHAEQHVVAVARYGSARRVERVPRTQGDPDAQR